MRASIPHEAIMLFERVWIATCRMILGLFALVILAGTYYAKFPEFVFLPWAARGIREIPLAEGFDSNRNRNSYFTKRLSQHFPDGSMTNDLERNLRWYRFDIEDSKSPGFRYAYLQGGLVVCDFTWSVRWKSDSGMISNLSGSYSESCL